LDNGHIAEEGTYEDLIQRNGPFQRLIAEFGGQKEEQKEEDEAEEEGAIEQKGATPALSKLSRKVMGRAAGTGKLEGRLMLRESEFRSITAMIAVIRIGIDGKPCGSPKDRLCTYQNMLQVPTTCSDASGDRSAERCMEAISGRDDPRSLVLPRWPQLY
jgi:hypothetical protein